MITIGFFLKCKQITELTCDYYIAYLKPFNCVQKRAQAHLRMSYKNMFTNHMYLMYV